MTKIRKWFGASAAVAQMNQDNRNVITDEELERETNGVSITLQVNGNEEKEKQSEMGEEQ